MASLIPREHVVEKANGVASGFLQRDKIQFCIRGVRIIDEGREVDAADAAIAIGLEGLLRAIVDSKPVYPSVAGLGLAEVIDIVLTDRLNVDDLGGATVKASALLQRR